MASSATPTNSQLSGEAETPGPALPMAARGGRGGRGKARGGRAPPAPKKGRVTKPSAVKHQSSRGRRAKVYDNVKAQAAHERMAELKTNFNTLARAMKPALSELADRTIKKLTDEPDLAEKAPEAAEIRRFLDSRLGETIRSIDQERDLKVANAKEMFRKNIEVTKVAALNKILEAECEMLDTLMARADCLEYLRDLNLPVDLPDKSYEYREFTQEQVDSQGPYVHHNEQGDYIPCVEPLGITVSQLQCKEYQLPEVPTRKRKGGGNDPDEQPNSKRLAIEEDLPVRHVKSMLSAVEEIPERSASQSARAQDGPEEAPVVGDVDEVNGLPVPKGASLPDEYGVRIITKARDKRANNRIMAPSAVVLDNWQIGFRDSTNHPDKGATRARRGEYFQQANSHAMYYDRRVAEWNSTTQAEEDYDQDLVRKHRLHPRLGIFLPSSVNWWEKPEHKEMDQYRPVVHVGPKGQIIHSSRSVPRFRLDQASKKEESRVRLKNIMGLYLEETGMPEENIVPDKEIRAKIREEVLFSRAIDPASLPTPRRCLSPEQIPEDEISHEGSARTRESSIRETLAVGHTVEEEGEPREVVSLVVDELLEAAAVVEDQEKNRKKQEEQEAEAEAAARAAAKPQTRPYDAVRDMFTNSSSPTTAPPAELVTESDTYRLSLLADIAEEKAEEERAAQDTSMMDPALFSSEPAAQPAVRPQYQQIPYQAAPMSTPASIPPPIPASFPVPTISEPPARANDFLRTALNPQTPSPVYPAIPPPPPSDYPSPSLRGALPSLRPTHDASPPPPEFHGSPAARPNVVVSNSGAYYPPAPPRPYHNGYSYPEPSSQQQLATAALQQHGRNMAPPPPPPPAHNHQYPPLQPMGIPLYYPPPPMDQAPYPTNHYGPPPPGPMHTYGGPPPMTPSGQPMRGQPGSSGNSKQQYRKLEPAPTPPTRSRPPASQPRELRTVQFDYRESIKDYAANEAPPSHGPNQIRGWSHQNLKSKRHSTSKADGSTPSEPS